MKDIDIRICRYDSSLKDQLMEFLGLLKSNINSNEREKLFKWTYESNPYSQKPFIYLALKEEQIVAHFAFVIQKFVCNKNEFLFGIADSAIVHPDFRRKGLFSKLIDYAYEDMCVNSNIRLLLVLSSNKTSTLGLLNSGFIPMGVRGSLFRISLLNKLKKNIRCDCDLDKIFISNKNEITIEITRQIKVRELSGLQQKIIHKNRICNIRDEEFYRWRFVDTPYKYICAYCTERDHITGYLILRKYNAPWIEYVLEEYGYLKQSSLIYLIQETSKKLLITGIITSTLSRNQEELSNLKKSGFFYSYDVKLPALIKPISPDFSSNAYFIDGVDMRLSTNWSLFNSDEW